MWEGHRYGLGEAMAAYIVCPRGTYGKDCKRTCDCDSGSVCDVTDGHCRPSCPAEWTGLHCEEDVDECAVGLHKCPYRCYNMEGAHSCVCPLGGAPRDDGRTCKCAPGFQISADKSSCEAIDECAAGNHQCSHLCHNTEGGHTCSCPPGGALKQDGATCVCANGFQFSSDNSSCEDIDECATGDHQCSHVCHNTEGGHTCSCPPGGALKQDGPKCTCETGFHFSSDGLSCEADLAMLRSGTQGQTDKSPLLKILLGLCGLLAGALAV